MSNVLGICTIEEMKKFYFLFDRMRKILEEYGVKISYKTLENLGTGIEYKPTYTVILDEINLLKQNKEFTKETDKSDQETVSHPKHYCEGRKYEPKDVIRDWGLNFNTGSAVKYLSRAGRKGDIIEDLEKAKQFIQFEIDYLLQEKEMEKMNCAAEKIVNFLGDLKG